jgi:hypothetical protein
MRAVWSFWSKPYEYDRYSVWYSEKHHLLSWILSVETARRHYPDTCLVTDSQGARTLVDGLGLPFETVSTALDHMEAFHPDWWALGKLHAYRAQERPFIHIDSDVYLWKRPPLAVEHADVFAQSPEYFSLDGGSWYRPRECIEALRGSHGWVPDALRWYAEQCGNKAACCGVFGGNHLDFIGSYADLGIRSVAIPENRTGWARLGGNMADNLVVEQYLLIACIEHHNHLCEGGSINIQYLFDSPETAFSETYAKAVGYTHLIGEAKHNQVLAKRLEQRVRSDYPGRYTECLRYLADSGIPV